MDDTIKKLTSPKKDFIFSIKENESVPMGALQTSSILRIADALEIISPKFLESVERAAALAERAQRLFEQREEFKKENRSLKKNISALRGHITLLKKDESIIRQRAVIYEKRVETLSAENRELTDKLIQSNRDCQTLIERIESKNQDNVKDSQ